MDIKIGDIVEFKTYSGNRKGYGEVIEISEIKESNNKDDIDKLLYAINALDGKYDIYRRKEEDIRKVYREVQGSGE